MTHKPNIEFTKVKGTSAEEAIKAVKDICAAFQGEVKFNIT